MIISILFAKRKTRSSVLADAWRTQIYYTIAIIISTLVQRLLQSSLFHEFESFNLAYISLISGLSAMDSELRLPARPSPKPGILFPATALYSFHASRILVVLLFFLETVSLSRGCKEEKVFWWFLGARIDLVKMPYLPIFIFFGSCVLSFVQPLSWISKLIFREPLGGDSRLRFVGVTFELVVLVVGIELSIHMNGLPSGEISLRSDQVRFVCLIYFPTEKWRRLRHSCYCCL